MVRNEDYLLILTEIMHQCLGKKIIKWSTTQHALWNQDETEERTHIICLGLKLVQRTYWDDKL